MTVMQKQCLLAFLGYYPGAEIDGIWGPKSRAGTLAFQRKQGLTENGEFEEETERAIRKVIGSRSAYDETEQDWWQEIQWFDREEFRCKCGGKYCNGYPTEMKRTVVELADRARKHFGKPGIVVSGLRCRQHNANCGGVLNSQHMYGEALDLQIVGVSADALLDFMKAQKEVHYAYKINGTNVHFDIAKGKS